MTDQHSESAQPGVEAQQWSEDDDTALMQICDHHELVEFCDDGEYPTYPQPSLMAAMRDAFKLGQARASLPSPVAERRKCEVYPTKVRYAHDNQMHVTGYAIQFEGSDECIECHSGTPEQNKENAERIAAMFEQASSPVATGQSAKRMMNDPYCPGAAPHEFSPDCGQNGCTDAKPAAPVAPQPTLPTGIYVASRASIPERSAMWREYRAKGVPITSSWIDEAGEGETRDFGELWDRIFAEISRSERLILYVEEGDFPLKGALIEVGIALGLGKPVFIIAHGVQLEPRSFRPLGSWVKHKLVTFCKSVPEALKVSSGASAAAETCTTTVKCPFCYVPMLSPPKIPDVFFCDNPSCPAPEYAPTAEENPASVPKKWKCLAQRSADPPQDCDWPTCGCDPYANKVLEAVSHLLEGAAETRQPRPNVGLVKGRSTMEKLEFAMALLQRTSEAICDNPPDQNWFRDYFLLTGENMILVDGSWEPASLKPELLAEDPEWEPDDEVNAGDSADPLPAVGAETAPRWIGHQLARQLICRHPKAYGGNDYQLCPDCELEWDYTKTNPLIAIRMHNPVLSEMLTALPAPPVAPEGKEKL